MVISMVAKRPVPSFALLLTYLVLATINIKGILADFMVIASRMTVQWIGRVLQDLCYQNLMFLSSLGFFSVSGLAD